MQPIRFIGEYLNCLDDAGRMLLPDDVRRQMISDVSDGALYVTAGPDRTIWLYRAGDYERGVSEADRARVAMSWRVEPDYMSRIKLPPKLISLFKTPQDLILIGVSDHLELCDRTEWRKRSQAIL